MNAQLEELKRVLSSLGTLLVDQAGRLSAKGDADEAKSSLASAQAFQDVLNGPVAALSAAIDPAPVEAPPAPVEQTTPPPVTPIPTAPDPTPTPMPVTPPPVIVVTDPSPDKTQPPANAPRVEAGADISKVASGSVLRPGKYTASGNPKPGFVLYGDAGGEVVVMLKDGQQWGTKEIGNLKLYNFGFEGGASAANHGNDGASVRIGDNCYCEDVFVRKSKSVGFDIEGNDCKTLRLLVEDCAGSGRGANSAHRYHEIGAIVRRCNAIIKDHDGGGGKLLKGYNIIIEGGQFYQNTGAGMWFDWDAQGVIIRNNKFWGQLHWTKSGGGFDVYGTARDLYIEGNIKGPGLIEGNTFDGSEGERISLAESAFITIKGNTFNALPATSPSTRRLAAIAFRDISRAGLDGKMGSGYLHDITVTGNTFNGTNIIRGDGGQDVTLAKNKITVAADNVWNGGGKVLIPA